MLSPIRQVCKYVFSDVVAAAAAWTILFIYRKDILETEKFGYQINVEFDETYFLGLISRLCLRIYCISIFNSMIIWNKI